MSDIVKQNASFVPFKADDSWVILSPIEQRIKEKIESVGTPLKDWDISISRGIITGLNDAFIISSEKRDEILRGCGSDDERERTAKLIRPILRGRDIKRYGYSYNNLYVILAEYGSYKWLEKSCPSIYKHLLQYETELKKRGQCRYKANGKPDPTAEYPGQHHWLELDNNPKRTYLEDFAKHKIMYPNMTKYMPFYLDNLGFMQNDKSFLIVGENLAYLTAFLNSSLFKYCFIDNFPELQGGTRELRKIFFDKIPVLKVDTKTNNEFAVLVNKIQEFRKIGKDTKELEKEIDSKLFQLYELDERETNIIGFIEIE